MNAEHDDRDLLSEAGQARRDRMLPLMQDAMRNASRQRRQRRSLAASLVLLVGVFVGWELIELGTSTPRAPEMVIVDSSNPTTPNETSTTPLPPAESGATADPKWDWASFDPLVAYKDSITEGVLVSSESPDSIPATWVIDRTLVDDIPRVTSEELVAMLADSGIAAAVLCDASRCTLQVINPPQPDDETEPSTPLSQDPTQDNVQRKTALIPPRQSPDLCS